MSGIFERMSTIIKSNVNDLLNKYEDPEKIIDQTIIDATKEYAKAKEEALNTLASEKTAREKLNKINSEADKWHNIAIKALKAGNEDDARAALKNEEKEREKAQAQKKAYNATKEAADTVREKLSEMEDEIRQMKDKADEIKAASAAAKTLAAAGKVKEMGIDSSFDKFKKMEEKAHKELAKAQAKDELEENERKDRKAKKDLENKYTSSSKNTDEALEDLKKELGIK